LWFVQRGTLCCGEFSFFLKKFQTMKANLKVILSVVGLAALQTEVLGLPAKAGHPNRQRRSLPCCAEEPIRLASTGSPWRVLCR
jgi:hypothetical protein